MYTVALRRFQSPKTRKHIGDLLDKATSGPDLEHIAKEGRKECRKVTASQGQNKENHKVPVFILMCLFMVCEVGHSQQPMITVTPVGTFSTPLKKNANYSASGLGTNVSAADRAEAEAAQFRQSRANTQMIQTPMRQGRGARVNAKRQGNPANKRNTTVINNAVYENIEPDSVDAIMTGPPDGLAVNEDETQADKKAQAEKDARRQASLDRQRWQNQARSEVESAVIGKSTSMEAQEMRNRIESGGYTPGDRNMIDSENRGTIFNMRFDAEQEQRKKGDDSWKNRGNDIIQRQEEQRKKDDESGQRLRERITPFSWER